jgi:hypothetical protein
MTERQTDLIGFFKENGKTKPVTAQRRRMRLPRPTALKAGASTRHSFETSPKPWVLSKHNSEYGKLGTQRLQQFGTQKGAIAEAERLMNGSGLGSKKEWRKFYSVMPTGAKEASGIRPFDNGHRVEINGIAFTNPGNAPVSLKGAKGFVKKINPDGSRIIELDPDNAHGIEGVHVDAHTETLKRARW